MTGKVIEHLRDIIRDTAPDHIFECDDPTMINKKVDSVPRDQNFVYIEEPTYGHYDIPRRGFERQRTFIRLYFCKFEEMHSSAMQGDSTDSQEEGGEYRIPKRDDIEETMVRPFLYALRHSELGMRYPEMITSIRVIYPAHPRFDANEVSVGLEFMFYEDVCLDMYRRP